MFQQTYCLRSGMTNNVLKAKWLYVCTYVCTYVRTYVRMYVCCMLFRPTSLHGTTKTNGLLLFLIKLLKSTYCVLVVMYKHTWFRFVHTSQKVSQKCSDISVTFSCLHQWWQYIALLQLRIAITDERTYWFTFTFFSSVSLFLHSFLFLSDYWVPVRIAYDWRFPSPNMISDEDSWAFLGQAKRTDQHL